MLAKGVDRIEGNGCMCLHVHQSVCHITKPLFVKSELTAQKEPTDRLAWSKTLRSTRNIGDTKMAQKAAQIVLAARPQGAPQKSDFRIETNPLLA